jgi:endoglycosylceramidase
MARFRRITALVGVALAAGLAAVPASHAATAAPSTLAGSGTLSTKAGWLTDPTGRVVILHGLNQVYKVAPYLPSTDGFGADDAAFLAANGFDAVRVGVIWSAVEPQPGHYDDHYLAGIAATVRTLAAHGIVSLLDFHQDLFNEKFQGEGAPAWAVQDGGLPNPPLGFPGNYFANPAENHAWDQFWGNASAPDGVGLIDHYAATWRHVAATFATEPGVAGYEILNEPWPGSTFQPCFALFVGCSGFDGELTAFYNTVDRAIRQVDHTHLVWFEPNTLFNQGIVTKLGTVADPHTVFAFHDYCGTEAETNQDSLCPPQDTMTFDNALAYTSAHHIPTMITEFGATNDLQNLQDTVTRSDADRFGWLEWGYTGADITSQNSGAQALVYDPSKPPTGANVNAAKLKVLAEPYPQVVAGTPTSWAFSAGVFTLTYTTAKVGGGRFATGAESDIAVPKVQFPAGYHVQVSGGRVLSAPNAPVLRVAATRSTVTVRVS